MMPDQYPGQYLRGGDAAALTQSNPVQQTFFRRTIPFIDRMNEEPGAPVLFHCSLDGSTIWVGVHVLLKQTLEFTRCQFRQKV